jgi:hypothetical protein
MSCFILKGINLSNVGDLDRTNEEIVLSMYSTEYEIDNTGFVATTLSDVRQDLTANENYILNCGVFVFDSENNTREQEIDISFPCSKGNYVGFRMVEKDNCNDDEVLELIECETTSGLEVFSTVINPDSTATSNTQCFSVSSEVTVCGSAKVGGVEVCGGVSLGVEECNSVEVTETTSRYHIVYQILESNCPEDWTLDGNQVCGHGKDAQLTPSEICSVDAENPINDEANIVALTTFISSVLLTL